MSLMFFDAYGAGLPDYDTGLLVDEPAASGTVVLERDYRLRGRCEQSSANVANLTVDRWAKRGSTVGGFTYKVKAKIAPDGQTRLLTARVFRAGTKEKVYVEKYPR